MAMKNLYCRTLVLDTSTYLDTRTNRWYVVVPQGEERWGRKLLSAVKSGQTPKHATLRVAAAGAIGAFAEICNDESNETVAAFVIRPPELGNLSQLLARCGTSSTWPSRPSVKRFRQLLRSMRSLDVVVGTQVYRITRALCFNRLARRFPPRELNEYPGEERTPTEVALEAEDEEKERARQAEFERLLPWLLSDQWTCNKRLGRKKE